MADPAARIAFRCPDCRMGFEIRVTDLTDDQQQAIAASCGNKHPKLVRMERVPISELGRVTA